MSQYLAKVIQNLLTYSEQFDHADWGIDNVSISANDTIAPDGTLTADKVIENSINQVHRVLQAVSGLSTDTLFTGTYYVKVSERTKTRALMTDGVTTFADIHFDLSSGTITSSPTGSGTIEGVGNGWYRVSVTGTSTSGTTITLYCSLLNEFGSITYLGDGVSGLYVWGGQLEEEADVGAYQKTEATALTAERESLKVEPEYDYIESAKKVEARHRTRAGREYVYKFGDYDQFKFSLMYVDNTFKGVVNSWWNNNTELLYVRDDVGYEVSSVKLINKALPIGKAIKPYTDSFKGVIELAGY